MKHKDQLYTLDVFFNIEELKQVTCSNDYLLESYKALIGTIPAARLAKLSYFHKEILEDGKSLLKITILGKEWAIDYMVIEIDFAHKHLFFDDVIRRAGHKQITNARDTKPKTVHGFVGSLYLDGMKLDGQLEAQFLDDESAELYYRSDNVSCVMINAFSNCFGNDTVIVNFRNCIDEKFWENLNKAGHIIRDAGSPRHLKGTKYRELEQKIRAIGKDMDNHYRMKKLAHMVVLNESETNVAFSIEQFNHAWDGIAGWKASNDVIMHTDTMMHTIAPFE